MDKVCEATKEYMQRAQSGLNSFSEKLKNSENSGKLYKVFTTIFGLTTSVINPLLEVVLVFLPEIISFFTRDNKKDQIKEQIISNIIPSIKIKLREEMPALFNEQINVMVEVVSDSFEEQLKQKEAEILEALKSKSDDIEVTQKQISTLEKAKKEIENLANQNLYK